MDNGLKRSIKPTKNC